MPNFVPASDIHEFLDLLYESYNVKSTQTKEKGIEFTVGIALKLTKTNNKDNPQYQFEALEGANRKVNVGQAVPD